MRHAVFLDTSGWIAAAIRTQVHHEKAKAAYTTAIKQGYRIVTTPMVLGESHALFLRLLGRDKAEAAVDGVLRDPTHVVLPVEPELIHAALDGWIRRFPDQSFSLCDAVSFEVMKREALTRALAIDNHFRAAGFEID